MTDDQQRSVFDSSKPTSGARSHGEVAGRDTAHFAAAGVGSGSSFRARDTAPKQQLRTIVPIMTSNERAPILSRLEFGSRGMQHNAHYQTSEHAAGQLCAQL